MTRPSDEILNAYVDGALDPAQAAEVAAYLETDEEARQFCEMLRKVDALALEAFAEPMRGAPPQALIDAIMKAPGGGPAGANGAPSGDNVVSFRRMVRSLPAALLPLAAVLVLSVAAGLLALTLLRSDPRAPELLAMGQVAPASPLGELLESGRRGATADVADPAGLAGRLSLVATFQDKSGRYCREVEVLPAGGDPNPLSLGIGCRDAGGQWTIEGVAHVADRVQAKPGFEPAGSPADDSLKSLIEKLGLAKALSPAEEEAKVASRWQ